MTGGGVRDAIEGLLLGVNERSSSKLMSMGECAENGEFGEPNEGDKGGVCVPLIREISERWDQRSENLPTAL